MTFGLPDFQGAVSQAHKDIDAELSLVGRAVRPCLLHFAATIGEAAAKALEVLPIHAFERQRAGL